MFGEVRKICCMAAIGGVLALVGCSRISFEQREAWRGEAEQACLSSGAVREGSSVTIVKAINGPGVCGADYPLRVAALGEPAIAGFGDEVIRPSGTLPGMPNFPSPAQVGASQSAPYYPQGGAQRSYPPAGSPQQNDPQGSYQPVLSPDGYTPSAPRDYYPQRAPETAVPLGRAASAPISASPAFLNPAATLACPLVSKLDRFVTERVQPAALRWFGQPVVEIRQISSYSCRGMNGDPNAHISEHAFGNAIDIAAFTFADGRKVTVKDGWHGAPEEQGFLRDIHGAACETFTTVLAPGSNAYHYDHMHVDLMRRPSGRIICEPAAISGEVAAARAGGRGWRPGEATGSVTADQKKSFFSRLLSSRSGNAGAPHAIAGED